MEQVKIYYIKDIKGKLSYTNTNELEFAQFVNNHLVLDLGKYPTLDELKEAIPELEIGVKYVNIEF